MNQASLVADSPPSQSNRLCQLTSRRAIGLLLLCVSYTAAITCLAELINSSSYISASGAHLHGFDSNPQDHPALHRWDGIWYYAIARDGYGGNLRKIPHTAGFLPFYSYLARVLAFTTNMDLRLALLCVSQVMFVVALFLLYLYLVSEWEATNEDAFLAIILFLALPAAFSLVTSHCESCFLALCLTSTLAVRNRRYVLASIAAYCAAFTRVHGVALIAAIAIQAWQDEQKQLRRFTPAVGGCAGLLTFFGICKYQFGDAFYYFTAKKLFGPKPFTEFPNEVIARYNRILENADLTSLFGMVEVNLFLVSIVAMQWLWKARKFPELVFVGISLAMTVAGGSTWGMPRFVMFYYPLVGLAAMARIAPPAHSFLVLLMGFVQFTYLVTYVKWIYCP